VVLRLLCHDGIYLWWGFGELVAICRDSITSRLHNVGGRLCFGRLCSGTSALQRRQRLRNGVSGRLEADLRRVWAVFRRDDMAAAATRHGKIVGYGRL
jgi:hypothetical protein